MHILMADDDKDDFHILEEAVKGANEQVTVAYAANWMDLWRFLLKHVPDVIFLDLNMPVKDGFECLQLLRAERKYNKIPIIIYSSSTNRVDIDKSYNLGANYFVVKPNSVEEISKILQKITRMSKEQLQKQPSREEYVIID
jgi:DNA-binding response OmpR family regulator